MTKKYFQNPSSSDSNLSDNKRCYSSSSTSNFEESPIIISESHENLNREDYLIKRKKNNASARKCREKRKKQMAMVFTKIIIWNICKAISKVNSIKFFILKNRFQAGNFKDAASTLDFNRFIRKEVLRKGSKYCLNIIFFIMLFKYWIEYLIWDYEKLFWT